MNVERIVSARAELTNELINKLEAQCREYRTALLAEKESVHNAFQQLKDELRQVLLDRDRCQSTLSALENRCIEAGLNVSMNLSNRGKSVAVSEKYVTESSSTTEHRSPTHAIPNRSDAGKAYLLRSSTLPIHGLSESKTTSNSSNLRSVEILPTNPLSTSVLRRSVTPTYRPPRLLEHTRSSPGTPNRVTQQSSEYRLSTVSSGAAILRSVRSANDEKNTKK